MIKQFTLYIFCCITSISFGQKINGVNLVSSITSFSNSATKPVNRISANYIALTPFLLMKEGSPEIYYETTGNYWGDYRINMKKIISEAHQSGKKIMLKPHIFVENVGWAGTLNFSSKNWTIWESNFTKRILDFAKFAEDNKVEMLCIGVELKSATTRNPFFFKQLIKKIRYIYKGRLTYAANWDNYQKIKFWSDLDFIGIDGYFPISLKKTPSKLELEKGWEKTVIKLKAFSNLTNKKIIFTEFGYRSCDYSSGKQWEIENNKNIPINYSNQNNGYEVFFEKVYTQDFVAGGFIWKWYSNENELKLFKKNNYTPQRKPAEYIINKWYSKFNSK